MGRSTERPYTDSIIVSVRNIYTFGDGSLTIWDDTTIQDTKLSRPEVTIVDYGAGNLRSVERAVQQVGGTVRISAEPAVIEDAPILILPGVGAAADTMCNLQDRRLVEPIKRYIQSGRPFLGVCMGLQALLTVSEEGGLQQCLDIVPGRVTRLPAGQKVPHMGWNQVEISRPHPALAKIKSDEYFYFVHSYYVEPKDPSVVAGWTEYGVRFASVVAVDNLIATQFHPEKSGDAGLAVYAGFIEWAASISR